MNARIDPRVTVGAVTLTVADLPRSIRYYQNNIGLRLMSSDDGQAVLGAYETPLLFLMEQTCTI